MKKRIVTLLLALLLAFSMTVPAGASEQYDHLFLALSELNNARLEEQGTKTLPNLSEENQFDLRVDIVDGTEDQSLKEYAKTFYELYEYGYGENKDGALLMIQVKDNGGSVDIVDHTVIGEGRGAAILDSDDSAVLRQMLGLMFLESEDLGYTEAGELCADAVDIFSSLILGFVQEAPAEAVHDHDHDHDHESIALPSTDELSGAYIMDNAALLTDDQQLTLETQAQGIAEEYDCGVYVLTVDTMNGAERREFAEEFYKKNHLGEGASRNGILFLVSMDTRDYVTVTYGRSPEKDTVYTTGIMAFTDKGIAEMEDAVVPSLSDGDYYGAFETYLNTCEEYLRYYAEKGKGMNPVDIGEIMVRLAIVVLVPLAIALAVCLILRSRMKTAKAATGAREYIPKESFAVTARRDQFVHTSRHREKIERSSSGSNSSVSSSGFGGSGGGKF